MAVILEAFNLVIRNDALNEHYPAGTRGYLSDAPNTEHCTDGRITRVGFMQEDDAVREARRLVAAGVLRSVDGGFDQAVGSSGCRYVRSATIGAAPMLSKRATS